MLLEYSPDAMSGLVSHPITVSELLLIGEHVEPSKQFNQCQTLGCYRPNRGDWKDFTCRWSHFSLQAQKVGKHTVYCYMCTSSYTYVWVIPTATTHRFACNQR
jgi:hypothetical protein